MRKTLLLLTLLSATLHAQVNGVFNQVTANSIPVSVTIPAYGAIGDNSTDNTAAFAKMEASTSVEFYVPSGYYKTTQSSLTKHYYGPGVILLGGPDNSLSGSKSPVLSVRSLGGDRVSAFQGQSAVDVLFIGDSITDCYLGATQCPESYAYSNLIQAAMNRRAGGIGQGGHTSGAQTGRMTKTGTWALGTHGPLHSDLILQPGASASFTCAFCFSELLTTYNVTGGGTITISGQAGTWGTVSTAGTGETKSGGISTPDGINYASQTITLSCSGSGPCEITNNIAGTIPTLNSTTSFIQVVANGGYATADFDTTAALDSIAFNRLFTSPGAGYSIALLAIGTNDIFNPAVAVTPAVFKVNYNAIVSGLKSRGIFPVLVIPLHAATGTYAPVLAPYDAYRDIILEIARNNECQIVDLSELDLAHASLLGGDGLHPIQAGYAAIANYITYKLGLTQMESTPNGQYDHPISAMADPTNTLQKVISMNDINNINRSDIYAIDSTSSPVPSWPLQSTVMESLSDLVLDASTNNLHLQTNRIDRLVITPTYVDQYWTASAACTTGAGQPAKCAATTTLPVAMPDSNYQIFCSANTVSQVGGGIPDLGCALEIQGGLPTAAGSTLNFDVVQFMQNGGGGGTADVYFHAHHN